jgi:hypothetical protein
VLRVRFHRQSIAQRQGVLRLWAEQRTVPFDIVYHLITNVEIVETINEPVTFSRIGCAKPVDNSVDKLRVALEI